MTTRHAGSGGGPSLRLRSELREVARADRWIHRLGTERGVPEDMLYDLRLALDEALSNIIRHGYGEGAPGAIVVEADISAAGARVTIRDRARPFNPLEVPEPDLSGGIQERAAGGLGVFLLRKVMDRVAYAREGDENRLVLERLTVRTRRSDP